MLRRRFLATALALPLAARAIAPTPTLAERRQDSDAAVRLVVEGYPWLGERRVAWQAALGPARERMLRAATPVEFARATATLLEVLRDEHAAILLEGQAVFRRVPADTDAWAHWEGGKAVVAAVRASSVADVAGLHPGHELVHVQGVPVERVMRELLQREAAEGASRDWALRRVLAGPRAGTFRLGVREAGGGATKLLEIARSLEPPAQGAPLLVRRIGDKRDLGYLRIRDQLGDAGLVMHFDAALQHLRDTRALVLDLRDTPSGGSDAVVAALLGRFTKAPAPWQHRQAQGKPMVVDNVGPRGAFAYEGPVVALVDRWTAAEGEALACGLRAVAKARLIGTPMARLHGRALDTALPHSGLTLRLPRERTFTPDGHPREAAVPDISVDLAAPSGGPADPILYQGLRALEK